LEDSAIRKIAVYIATTGGPVRVERITQEPAPQSVVCLRRSSEVLPISGDYDDFVRPGSGVIVREFGPFQDNAFRLDLSGSISAGKSWQFGVFVAHALDAAPDYALAENDEEAEEILWLTGLVDYDLNLASVNHIAEKLVASQKSFAKWNSSGKNITLCLAKDRNAQEVSAIAGVDVLGLESAVELLRIIGVYKAASSSEVIPLEPLVETYHPLTKKKKDKGTLWLLLVLVLGALGYLAYFTAPTFFSAEKEAPGPQPKNPDVTTVELPTPPDVPAVIPVKKLTKPKRKGQEKKVYELAEDLINGIERSRKALTDKGDKYAYNSPPRVVLWPFGQGDNPLNPRAAKKLNDRLVSALLETGEGEFTFMARDELKTIIEDMEATGALDQQNNDPIAALLKDASNVDVMI